MNDQKPVDPKSEVKPDAPAPVVPAAAAAPGQTDQPPVKAEEVVDPAAARAARLAEIDRELVVADRAVADAQAKMASLRRERDSLQAQGLGPAISQAEALQAVVKSDQEQRLNRAALAAAVTGLVGSSKMPTVKTPAEIKAAMTRKPIQLPKPPQQ